jgi:hypothetical protein
MAGATLPASVLSTLTSRNEIELLDWLDLSAVAASQDPTAAWVRHALVVRQLRCIYNE